MSQYYFAVASLPQLTYEMEKLPDIEEFLEVCKFNTTLKDFELIKAAGSDNFEHNETTCDILNGWFVRERFIRNKLVILRAKKRNEAPEKFLRENPDLPIDDKFIRDAVEDDSPLAAEEILNRERWSYLEEIELGHYFDAIKLIIYYLKLQLLWRKRSFDKEKGIEKFDMLIEKISTEDFFGDNVV